MHVVWRADDLTANVFGRGFQGIEVIGVVAKEVVDRGLGRGPQQLARRIAQPRQPLDCAAMAEVKLKEQVHQPRRMIDRGPQFRQIRPVAVEGRIGNRAAQFGQPRGIAVAEQFAHVHAIGFGQGHEHRHRKRTLVVLEQVHIGRADLQPPGHLGLGVAVVAAKLPQLRSDQDLAHIYNITKRYSC